LHLAVLCRFAESTALESIISNLEADSALLASGAPFPRGTHIAKPPVQQPGLHPVSGAFTPLHSLALRFSVYTLLCCGRPAAASVLLRDLELVSNRDKIRRALVHNYAQH
jgi:hypothetical protein